MISANLQAQQVFDRKTTDEVGNMGLSITNVGTIGKPDVSNNPAGPPSFEYPLDTGTEHLFEAGLWIGAVRGGSETLVSTAAVTNPSGYSTGSSGYEFTNDGTPINERSSIQDSPLFSPNAVSHQDLIAEFSDSRTTIETGTSSIPINGHEQPLNADVRMASYNWSFSFTESFSILKYEITNNSETHWEDVQIGMYADIVVRNVNSSIETGSAFYNKNGLGYLDSLYTTYAFDAGSNDQPSINTYGALSIIGANYNEEFFHPRNEEYLQQQGSTVPNVGPSYWLFSAGAGEFRGPTSDQDRYSRMQREFPLDEVRSSDSDSRTYREILRTDGQRGNGNYISMISIGPFPRIDAGETVTVYFAFTGARKPDQFQGLSGKPVDNEQSRQNLRENLGWVYRTFDGEDKNGNGKLDEGEDINNNGQLDRFLIPEPPQNPKMRVELDAGQATIYWDKRAERSVDPVTGERDFEGYKIYSSNKGDDKQGSLQQNAEVIAQYDSAGNNAGFNTGFDEIALDEPVTFEGDTTEYWYKYQISNLSSGWQYLFSVTAFDGGSENVELESLESSVVSNSVRVFPGTAPNEQFDQGGEEHEVGVYPNPYRVNAEWDGQNELTRKLVFYNLPPKAEVRIYTLSGDIVARMEHDASTYDGDIRWFNDFSSDNRQVAGGEHAWDILSESNQILTSGLYLYTVKDKNTGEVQSGKFAIIK